MKPKEIPSPSSPQNREVASSSSDRDYAAIAHQYARDVAAGRIPACQQAMQACRRHLSDLKRSTMPQHLSGTDRTRGTELPPFPFIFDPAAAARPCAFIEALPHIKGEWARRGERLTLEPWQIFIVAALFGWVERDEPTHYRFHEAYICVPRKNGKSTLDAGIMLYKFAADEEASPEVYFGATSREQADDVGFEVARRMAESTPALCKAFGIRVNKKSLRKADGGVMKPVIAKPGDGQSPSAASAEEYHEHASDALVNAMKTGMAARENPLLMYPTTAGVDRSRPCYALQLECEKVLAGQVVNDRLFAIVFTIDEEDDWKSDAALLKANPNWGISINTRKILADRDAAIASPRKEAIFKTKHLNVWVNAAVSWLSSEKWDACADPELRIEDFAGAECWDALDLADSVDLCAKILCFKRELEGKTHFYLFARHYLNQQHIDDASSDNFRRWADEGHLIATPGNITDYPRISDDVVADTRAFHVRELPHDPHHAAPLVQFMQARPDWDQSVECVAITPNVAFFSPAMKEFEAAVEARRIHHTGDPLLAWCVSNVICRRTRRDDVFPDKQNRESKIDGAVAALMAFGRANSSAPEDFAPTSVFSV